MKELVFGHKNPDTDTIACAKEYAYLQNKLGGDVEAVALGEPNDETKFVLDYFNEPAPRVITKAAPEVDAVMLVDHHRIANFETQGPLYFHAEPLGCCSTIIYKEYKQHGIDVPKNIAGLMLSGIISDTLLLKSPTTTDEDRQAVKELAAIAGVDYEEYGLAMLKAGTNLDDKSEEQLISADAKSFSMGGKTIRIDQINTVDLNDVFKREDAFRAAIEKQNAAEGYDLFLLMVTDILNSDTRLMVVGEPQDVVEKAFGKKITDGKMDLPGVVSRKKQVVPPLEKAF